MKEDFLHYIWKFKKLSLKGLRTESDEELQIISFGTYSKHAGPDFFNAQIRIADQLWAGNVEIHLKSSHWYAHHHEKDSAYNNVILHVVWEHDVEVFNSSNSKIPTLVLKDKIAEETIAAYNYLLNHEKKFINCENQIDSVDGFLIERWLERLFFERLEQKTKQINKELESNKNDWEEVLFKMLCKNFGSKVNADAFFDIANALPYGIIRKNCNDRKLLEALFYGTSFMLEDNITDTYYLKLKEDYNYLKRKYQLKSASLKPQYFSLRPHNFPTIRLSQLAGIYHKEVSLFQKIISIHSMSEYYELFDVSASSYWNNHYTFGKKSPSETKKKISKNFVDLLLINTIIPIKFCYAKTKEVDVDEKILKLIQEIQKEKNSLINKFESIGLKATSAIDSQAILQLYNNYCSKNKCLECEIGVKLVR